MQIRHIRLERFGACSDLSLDSLSGGVNVIHGPAGSGKATVSRLIRAILYGFDDSTRRQYLPANSWGFGGSLKIRTHSGQQTITRTDDGSRVGRLTIQHPDAAVLPEQRVPELISAIPESTFDRIYAVDYRRRPGIGALIEEAHTRGFDLLGRTVELDRLAVLQQQLRQQRDCLASIPRVPATYDQLCDRRVELVRVIGELEAALADEPDEQALTGQIQRLEAQLAEWQAELHTLRSQHRAAEHRRQQILAERDADRSARDVTGPSIDELNDLAAEIRRWQNTLHEITARRQRLEQDVDRNGSRELHGNPRRCLSEIESQLDHAQSTLASVDDATSYEGREIRSLFTATFAELRASVYRLCNQLSGWETAARHQDLSIAARDLVRCESELRLAIQSSLARKTVLQRDIEQACGEDVVALAPWNEASCVCAEHPPLAVPARVVERSADGQHELSMISAELESWERRQNRLLTEIGEVESELADVRARLGMVDQIELLDRLDAKRADLRHVEHNLRAADRRRELLAEIAATERAISELRADSRTSALVAEASDYLRRLTAGDLRKIEVAANEQVWVVDEHGRRRAYHQLSDGGRDLVYLSICLALVEGFKARGIHAPMIVSGVFTHVDSKNVPEAAELLRDIAAGGHQILLFTRHEHVASVFRLLNVPVRSLQQSTSTAAEPEETAPAQTADGSSADAAFAAPVESGDDVRGTFTLSQHSPIEEAPALDPTSAARLRKIGVMRVGDLLRLSEKSAAVELRESGITAEQVASWKAQTRLLCEVPRLRSYDARILVACGITEPGQLERLSPSELRVMVKEMAASSSGQALLLSGTEFELSRVADWIGVPHVTLPGKQSQSEPSGSDRTSSEAGRPGGDRRRDDRKRAERHQGVGDPDVVKMRPAGSPRQFYLGRSDSVVDAPSIGARTAERLNAVGIETVSDLLNADAESVSERLDVRRISADVVAGWQQQTELVCRVPRLRGHDAQILVALGITDVDRLAASDPQRLWTLVEPFVETKEGKRIIRNGKTPDFDEVRDWIQWAQASRQLNAA